MICCARSQAAQRYGCRLVITDNNTLSHCIMVPHAAETDDRPVTWRAPLLKEWASKIRAELIQLALFCWRPTRRHPADVGKSGITWRLAAVWAAYWVFSAIILAPILVGLIKLLGAKSTLAGSGTGMLILSVVVAPLVEEPVFRGGLRNATTALAVQPVLITLFFGAWQVALVLSGVVTAVILVDRVRQRHLDHAGKFALRMARGRAFLTRYRLVVWGYAVVFGLVHLGNFTIAATKGWLACLTVFIVSSQVVTGMFLSYFRLRYGLVSAMAFHAMWNASCYLLDKVFP